VNAYSATSENYAPKEKTQDTSCCVYQPSPHFCHHTHHDNYSRSCQNFSNLTARRI